MRAPWKSEKGTLTLVALCMTAVIGIALGSYLALYYQSYRLSQRNVQLSRARQLAETGLEEALWSLNNGSTGTWTNATWTISGANIACAITGYSLGEGASGRLDITIGNYAGNTPTITSQATVTLPGGGTMKRTLVATTKPAPLFRNAIGITNDNNGTVTFSNGVVDSWDSDPDGNFNPGGVGTVAYASVPHPTASTDDKTYAATVAAPNIALVNAVVYGYTSTFGNPITIYTSGSLSRVKARTTPGGTYIDTSRVSKSAFVPTFPVAAPSGSYNSTVFTSSPFYDSVGGPSDVWTLDSGNTATIGTVGASSPTQYSVPDDLLISGSGTTLTVQGPVVIRVYGNFSLYYAAKIRILSTGRLELYVSGNVEIGGAPGSQANFQNDTNEPKNLAIFSTATGSRNFIYYSARDFCGVLYSASNTNRIEFTSLQSTESFAGAILAKANVDFDGGTNPQIHYDLALQNLPKGWFKGVTTPFMVVQITES